MTTNPPTLPPYRFRCDRCDAPMAASGPARECQLCVAAARKVWPNAGPIRGEVSGA